jgi:hypothetical protein
MTKRPIILLFLMFLLGMLAIGCQQETIQTSAISSETYSNTRFGFSVSYPNGWKVSEDDAQYGVTIDFFKEGAAGVSILAWEPAENPFSSLEDFYYRGAIAAWQDHEVFEILEEYDTVIDKSPAKEVTFTYKTTDFIWKHTIVAFLDTRQTSPPNSNAFKIIYDMPLELPEDIQALYETSITYDNYYQDFRLIVDTFKFTK